MNKKRVIIIVMLISLIIIIGLCGSGILKIKRGQGLDKELEGENINEVTEISLGKEVWINSLTKINIKNTNDYFEITEKVKWEIPEHQEGTTISFSMLVPYTFIVNGVSYNGTYILGNSEVNKKPEGLYYNLEIINLTKDGQIKIKVTK